jgi:hypothetical protein
MPKKATSMMLGDETRADLDLIAAHYRLSRSAALALAASEVARRIRAEQAASRSAETRPDRQ